LLSEPRLVRGLDLLRLGLLTSAGKPSATLGLPCEL
jgi:hypothetical protein